MEVRESNGVRVDLYRHQAYAGDRKVHLTPGEFRLLLALVRRPGRVFSREELAQTIGDRTALETVAIHVLRVRRKLGDPSLIETVRGLGYRFRKGE